MKKVCSEKGCNLEARRRGMCMKHYDRAIHAKTIPVIQPKGLPLSQRIEKYSKKNTETDCIEWIGAKNEKGYGLLSIRSKHKKAHRLVWELANGPIPSELHVLHKCDNRACINLTHLFLGTHDDNMDDMNAKGRLVAHKGEKHGCAKLTEEQVMKIRSDDRPQRKIAVDYGVSQPAIGRIKRGHGWKHVINDSGG